MTIRITSKRADFRRCGIAHPAVATDYPDERFSAEELERLQAEPMLVVEVIEGKGKPAGTEATAAPGAPGAPGAAAAKPEPVPAKPVKAPPAKVAKAAKVTKAASGAKPAAKPAVEKTEPATQEPAGSQEQASGEGQ